MLTRLYQKLVWRPTCLRPVSSRLSPRVLSNSPLRSVLVCFNSLGFRHSCCCASSRRIDQVLRRALRTPTARSTVPSLRTTAYASRFSFLLRHERSLLTLVRISLSSPPSSPAQLERRRRARNRSRNARPLQFLLDQDDADRNVRPVASAPGIQDGGLGRCCRLESCAKGPRGCCSQPRNRQAGRRRVSFALTLTVLRAQIPVADRASWTQSRRSFRRLVCLVRRRLRTPVIASSPHLQLQSFTLRRWTKLSVRSELSSFSLDSPISAIRFRQRAKRSSAFRSRVSAHFFGKLMSTTNKTSHQP